MILLDTNVVSEAMKPAPDETVRAWLDEQAAEAAQKVAESAVAVALWVDGTILLPQDRHRHARPLQLDDQLAPVRLDPPPLTALRPGSREKLAGKGVVRQLRRQRPAQPGLGRPSEVLLNGTAGNPQHPTDLAGAHPAICKPQHLPQFSHRRLPLRRHHRLRLG
jgi:hypothetical protein